MDYEIEKHFDGETWQVKLHGEIDIYNSPELKTQLSALCKQTPADIHINCEKLEYIDSTGLGALVGVLKSVKGHGKQVRLSHVKPNIVKLFRITNLDKIFTISEVQEGAGEDND